MQTTSTNPTRRRGRRLLALVAGVVSTGAVLSMASPAGAYEYRGETTAPTTGTYQQIEPNYGAPTQNLENLARNTSSAAKGVNAAVRFAAYSTTSNANVRITVNFGSNPATTQTYSYANGNRFSTVFPIGDGQARWEWVIVKMVERLPDGREYQFTRAFQINIRPLWDVSISALKMKMLDNCDTPFQGSAGEVTVWFRHSGVEGGVAFSLGKDQSRWINEFAGTWREVGVSNDLRVPTLWWFEDDWDKPYVYGAPALGEQRILPGPTRTVSWIEYEYGGDCRAQFSYTINVSPRYYAV